MSGRGPTVLVASMGGVGSTAFMEWCAGPAGLDVNPARGLRNPLKHPIRPPRLPGIRRAVFLFGSPGASLISLFRRGSAALHYANVAGRLPADVRRPERTPWEDTVARFGLRELPDRPGVWVDGRGRFASDVGALDWLAERKRSHAAEVARVEESVAAIAGEAFRDLDAYLRRGVDALRWTEQLAAWLDDPPPPYPVLLVRSEALWDRLDEVASFLEAPPEAVTAFPARRPRASRVDDLTPLQRRRLEDLYGPLAERLAAEPVLRARAPGAVRAR